MRKQIEVKCDNCNVIFLKALSEVKRSLSNKNYCSLSCCAKHNNSGKYINSEKHYDISKHSSNKSDDYTKFRWYLKNIKQRAKYYNLSLIDLNNIWEKQQGVCPYTNIKLRLKLHSDKALNTFDNPFEFASLDRIDSSKGYIPDNIEFISVGINLLKSNFTKEQTISFINIIKEQDA
jgi:hypothetical protein